MGFAGKSFAFAWGQAESPCLKNQATQTPPQ